MTDKEHAPVMLDAEVRYMPTDNDFRDLLGAYGIGYHSAPQVGEHIAYFLARKWNIVLVEPSQKSLENDNG